MKFHEISYEISYEISESFTEISLVLAHQKYRIRISQNLIIFNAPFHENSTVLEQARRVEQIYAKKKWIILVLIFFEISPI